MYAFFPLLRPKIQSRTDCTILVAVQRVTHQNNKKTTQCKINNQSIERNGNTASWQLDGVRCGRDVMTLCVHKTQARRRYVQHLWREGSSASHLTGYSMVNAGILVLKVFLVTPLVWTSADGKSTRVSAASQLFSQSLYLSIQWFCSRLKFDVFLYFRFQHSNVHIITMPVLSSLLHDELTKL